MKVFPTAVDNGHSENQDGIDLRDYFAAVALVNLTHLSHQKDIARAAYAIADAMMEVRK